MRGKALPGTDRVHAFVGGRLDVDAIDRHAQAIRELSAHRGGTRGHARCLRDQRQVGLGDAVTGITYTTPALAAQPPAVDALELRVMVREGSEERRVGDGHVRTCRTQLDT